MDDEARFSMLGVAEVERMDRETPPLPDGYFLRDGNIFLRVQKSDQAPEHIFARMASGLKSPAPFAC
jgi:hypothetical protein